MKKSLSMFNVTCSLVCVIEEVSVALIMTNVSPNVILIQILSGKEIVCDELAMLRQSCAYLFAF